VLGSSGHTPPSEKLNVAIIGTGGQGTQNIKGLLGHADVQIMAICDVNEQSDYSRFYYGGTAGRKPARELGELLVAKVLLDEEGHPVVGTYPTAEASALWNYIMLEIEDGSLGVHNPDYTKALLEASVAALQ
jgi:hypothetical protein